MDLADVKRRARGEAARRRAAAHERFRDVAKQALAERGLPFPKGPEQAVVSGFFPYKSEISILALLQRLAGEGWVIAMPVVMGEGKPLVFRQWSFGDATVPDVWNIPVPPETAALLLPDVLLVPGLAFDRAGYRLGYGGGFYDRTLDKLRRIKPVVAIGAGYHAQLVDAVPHGVHDVALNFVMTEEETVTCG